MRDKVISEIFEVGGGPADGESREPNIERLTEVQKF
jgi:hypothetical protein